MWRWLPGGSAPREDLDKGGYSKSWAVTTCLSNCIILALFGGSSHQASAAGAHKHERAWFGAPLNLTPNTASSTTSPTFTTIRRHMGESSTIVPLLKTVFGVRFLVVSFLRC